MRRPTCALGGVSAIKVLGSTAHPLLSSLHFRRAGGAAMRISASLLRSVDNETIIDVILKAGVGRGI